MSYLWVFTVVNASQLCPSKGKPRQPVITGRIITKDGKEEHVITSPVASGTDPEWNFKMFQLYVHIFCNIMFYFVFFNFVVYSNSPANNVLDKYDCIKFKIKDKGSLKEEYLGESKIKWEFIGEPPKEKAYTLRISNLQKKKDAQIGGLLRVHTTFQLLGTSADEIKVELKQSPQSSPKVNYRLSRPMEAVQKLQKKGSFGIQQGIGTPGNVINKNTRVQFSAAGRFVPILFCNLLFRF